MSSAVLHFTPRAELSPQANVDSLVQLCRQSDVLRARGQFDKNVWDIGYLKGQNKVHRAVFSTLDAASRNEPEPYMSEPFLSFAKATLVYLQDKRPVASQSVRIAALRCLEAALQLHNKGARPTAVSEEVLDTAVELAVRQVSQGVAYRIAGQLEYMGEFMRTSGLAQLRQRWHHSVRKPRERDSRISPEALKARKEKLPSAALIRALGGIFHQATELPDVLVSSFAALMMCAPERINEVLRLERNCIVEGQGEFKGRVGIRWPGSKGANDTTKWLPTAMAPVADEAISNILKVTADGQRLAAWYTANPGTLYLHGGVEHLREQEVLFPTDIGLILWNDPKATSQATLWAKKTHGLEKHAVGRDGSGYLFGDVERAVLSMLPETFPYVPGALGLMCRDSMTVVPTNAMHASRATYCCMFGCVDYTVITNHFGARDGRSSIFERFDYKEDDGSPIELRSHSLRHYLNMLAQAGGLSSSEIAVFSGRKDTRQNRAYDHLSSKEVQAPIALALKNGLTADLVPATPRSLVLRSEFKKHGFGAAHTTQYGWCIHDFASEPCQMYRDCINCEEQVCVKGDHQKEENLRLLKRETEYLLKRAKLALGEEQYGADNWVRHQTATLQRIDALLAVIENPLTPMNARIRLNGSDVPLITANGVQPVRLINPGRRKAIK